MTPLTVFNDLIGRPFHGLVDMNPPMRLLISLAVMAAGIILAEWVIRSIRRRIRMAPDSGSSPEIWRPEQLMMPLRLIFWMVLLKIMVLPLFMSPRIIRILSVVECFLAAAAVVLVFFYLISLLERRIRRMPPDLLSAFPESGFKMFQRAFKLTIVLGVGIVFMQKQQILHAGAQQSSLWRYLMMIAIIASVYLLGRLIGQFLTRATLRFKEAPDQSPGLFIMLRAALWPVRILLASVVLYAAGEILVLSDPFDWLQAILLNGLAAIAVFLFVYRLLDLMEYHLKRYVLRDDNLMDQHVARVLGLAARFTVIIIGGIFIFRAVSGKPMGALLAGLGIGGLALALAAQDTLKNLFGGVMIMLDKPFNLGERIVVDGCDGVVEDIGFRSTRIRTLTGHLVTVPNEKMASNRIENIGRRPNIRRLTHIAIPYDTPADKLETALEIIRGILDNHEGMHPDLPPRVNFTEFNDTSLNIMMLYWYHPGDYWTFVAFSETVNLRIMRAFEAEGIEFAFPTSTTYLAQDDRRPLRIRLDAGAPAVSND